VIRAKHSVAIRNRAVTCFAAQRAKISRAVIFDTPAVIMRKRSTSARPRPSKAAAAADDKPVASATPSATNASALAARGAAVVARLSASPARAPSSAGTLSAAHDLTHSLMMTLLYLVQGLVQGSNNACVTLLHQSRTVSMSEASLLTLPMYAYSTKFLWAPVVDCCYLNKRTRRPLWALSCQVAVVVVSLAMALLWESHLRENVTLLVALMTLQSFTIATQDIAVDAWAIEGVSATRAEYGATAQSLGMLTGWCLTRSYFVVQELVFNGGGTSNSNTTNSSNGSTNDGSSNHTNSTASSSPTASSSSGATFLFQVLVAVQATVLVVSLFYVTTATCTVALDEAVRREIAVEVDRRKRRQRTAASADAAAPVASSSSGADLVVGRDSTLAAFAGVFNDMLEVVRAPWFGDVCRIVLLRGLCWAGASAVGTQQLKRFGVTPFFSSSLYLALLPLQIAVSSLSPRFIASARAWLSGNGGAAKAIDAWLLFNTAQLVVDCAAWLAFSTIARDAPWYRFGVICPVTVVQIVLSTVGFTAICGFTSDIAQLVPHSTGTAVTLLNSMLNLGGSFPQTAALAVAGQLAPFFRGQEDDASAGAGAANTDPLGATIFVLWAFFTVGLVLRLTVMMPAVRRVSSVLGAPSPSS
jgi:hypothetical protein